MTELLEAGVHFGSATYAWNPRMKPFIHGQRNKIHIIDLTHTVRGLAQGGHFLEEVAATGRQIVFVCTKRQMRSTVQQEATSVEMPWVTERWLGGTLTNFKTVRSRLERLEELEALEASGQMEGMKKKAVSTLNRERRRIKKNLDGLRLLNRIPGALLVVDPKREEIAVAEAQRIGVPIISILDTDCDPSRVDIVIPGNDDSMRSITLLLSKLTESIGRGVKRFKESGRAPEDALGVRSVEGKIEAVKQPATPVPAAAATPAADAAAATPAADAAPTAAAPATAAGTTPAQPAAGGAPAAAPEATPAPQPETPA